MSGGEPRRAAGARPYETAVRWNAEGTGFFVFQPGGLPADVHLLAPDGTRRLWKTLTPADLVGAVAIHRLIVTPDAATYAYTLERQLSDLYVVAGLE